MRRLTPASASIAIHTQPKMIVLTEIGLLHQQEGDGARDDRRNAKIGSDLSFS